MMDEAMTEFSCSYGDGRDEAIVALLYDDLDASAAERSRFETHLGSCARCQADVAALRGVRAQLARWSPPEPSFAVVSRQSVIASPEIAVRNPQWWRAIPAWAQVAAALLFLGVSAGIANLDVRYDQSGLSIRTGWSARSAATGGVEHPGVARANQTAPWRADIAALEQQLKSEIRAAQASSTPVPAAAVRSVTASAADADVTRRVRALVEESEKRQQRELALRIAGLLRDVNAQRQADMIKIDRTLGVVQNNVGIEVMKTRQQMNQMDLIYRASQRQ
jgi:anti-sigma factor RsiW